MKRSSFLVYAALIACVLNACAQKAQILPPYSVEAIRQIQPKVPLRAHFKCRTAPVAVRDLFFMGIYDNKNKSNINIKYYTKYKQDIKPISKYETGLIRLSNGYVQSNPADERLAACALTWLDDWARSEALLGEVNPMGEAIRKWTLATLSSSYIQIKDAKNLDPSVKKEVEDWLRDVGRAVVHDYSSQPKLRSRNNNHAFWAAWGVAITAAAVNDAEMFNWSMDHARAGLRQIQPDGTLPLELFRRERAGQYHLFATVPLTLLAEIGEANGVDLYDYEDGALHRLVKLDLAILQNPDVIARQASSPQKTDKYNAPVLYSWMQPYNNRFALPVFTGYLNRFSNLEFRRGGGDMKLLYNSAIKPFSHRTTKEVHPKKSFLQRLFHLA